MTRIKRGYIARQRRKKIFQITSGFTGSHSKLFRTANQQALKALKYAYADRRKKKRIIRSVWIRRINAKAKTLNTSYNKIIKYMKDQKIIINKKMLSEISIRNNSFIESLLEQK